MKVAIDERELIRNVMERLMNEDANTPYSDSTSPVWSKPMGNPVNPSNVEVGNNGTSNRLLQPSTDDQFGTNFNTDVHLFLKPNQMAIYKYKNFGNTNITSSMDLFGKNTVEFRKALDQLEGGAKRNNTFVRYRTITDEAFKDKAIRSEYMLYSFWSYRFAGKGEYYILKPDPIIKMKSEVFTPPHSQRPPGIMNPMQIILINQMIKSYIYFSPGPAYLSIYINAEQQGLNLEAFQSLPFPRLIIIILKWWK
ncbi:MAG: hypothetical protein EZS28_019544 [Streblomastix strix]|uniref:Uncharacterized protein n=1 Tax=Streblomastix strix TaxID=222440 RepID=A0A5J4VRA3_9EUKA|nr:MAG: hypothetical protein EZS28_019544 [Streblomastix strix]